MTPFPARRSRLVVGLVSVLTASLASACTVAFDAPAAPAPAGAVALLVEPEAGRDAILALVTGARRSLDLEMYLLTDDGVLDALVALRAAGVVVRVILEPHPYGADGSNQGAFDRLAAAGVDVAWASPRFALTHAKFFVVDGARLVVLTLNLTRAGLGGNRELAVVDDDARDVAAAAAVFAGDRAGAPPTAPLPSRLVASPSTSRGAIADAVARARSSIAVVVEELSDDALEGALAGAAARGCAVSVVLPGAGRAPATTAAARRLAGAGVTVRAVDAPTIHAKAVVVDALDDGRPGGWLYVGSANLTAASLDANRELGLALDDAPARATVAATIAGDLASGHPP